MGGSLVVPADGGDIGEGVGGKVDWAPNRTAAKSSPPLLDPFHPPVVRPAIRNRPFLPAPTAQKVSASSVPF